ncbi:MAG: hypothetical protein KGL43_02120 [Burkholderiales bacterium]|nr:hypothetical protein [Burkholderiales bacterium]MDE2395990.1 hypothetical protein [Burkholderiales bacterium]MDE2452366.1 hypothetical protein [Burkholderiales bacterium]
MQPNFSAAGSAWRWNHFVAADSLQSDLALEAPDGCSNPLHDRTKPSHAFAYLRQR